METALRRVPAAPNHRLTLPSPSQKLATMLSFTTNALALADGPHLAARPAILRGAASSSTTPLMMASEGPSNSLQAKALAAALATTVAAHAGPAAAAEPWAYSTLLELSLIHI